MIDRGVSRNHNDYRAVGIARWTGRITLLQFILQKILAQFATHGRAINRQDSAEIRLHENPYGVSAQRRRQFSGGCADSALETKGDGPSAGSYRAFLYRPAARALNRVENVIAPDIAPANIVARSIIGFTNQRINRLHGFIARQAKHVIDGCIGDPRNVQGRSQHDWRFDLTQLIYLS